MGLKPDRKKPDRLALEAKRAEGNPKKEGVAPPPARSLKEILKPEWWKDEESRYLLKEGFKLGWWEEGGMPAQAEIQMDDQAGKQGGSRAEEAAGRQGESKVGELAGRQRESQAGEHAGRQGESQVGEPAGRQAEEQLGNRVAFRGGIPVQFQGGPSYVAQSSERENLATSDFYTGLLGYGLGLI